MILPSFCFNFDLLLETGDINVGPLNYDTFDLGTDLKIDQYMYYLCSGFQPEEAIGAFDKARGHTQERQNYLNHIRYRTHTSTVPSLLT